MRKGADLPLLRQRSARSSDAAHGGEGDQGALKHSTGRVETLTTLVRDAEAIIADIVGSRQCVTGVVSEISAASERQRSGTGHFRTGGVAS